MDQKQRFNEKVLAMKAEYQMKLVRLKEVRQPGHKWLPQDYALVSKYDVLEVEKDTPPMNRSIMIRMASTQEGCLHSRGARLSLPTSPCNKSSCLLSAVMPSEARTGQEGGIVVKPIVPSKFNSRSQGWLH